MGLFRGVRGGRLLVLAGVAVLVPGFRSAPDAPSGPSVIRDQEVAPARRGFLADAPGFRPNASAFSVRAGGVTVTHRVMAVSVLPGEELALLPEPSALDGLTLRHRAGSVRPREGGWIWTAPSEPGIHAIRLEDAGGEFVHLNVLVLHPRSLVLDGLLNGYRIGRYQDRPLNRGRAYEPPRGFVEVGVEARDVLVSPHFTLGQFLCKQPGEPSYLVLSAPLVKKLEALLLGVNRAGHSVSTLHVMSGFRTPWYNRSIGNKTIYSRHLWGDAADVFVDGDGNGEMDDLNGDGLVDLEDGRVLYRLAEALFGDAKVGIRPGGLSLYRRNAVHGPFVHLDARGVRARW